MDNLYPERCSGLYTFWAFSPSLLKCNSANSGNIFPKLLLQDMRLLGFQPVFAAETFWKDASHGTAAVMKRK